MTCNCGHHQPSHRHADPEGTPVVLQKPLIALSGRLTCADAGQLMTVLALLPDHLRQSREEPGCLRFDLWQDDDPRIWHLSELFLDAEAFAAHGERSRDSAWGRESASFARDFHRREVIPVIRPESAGDAEAIDALLRDGFGGDDEARLVRRLRADGDLALSLVAEAEDTLLGHVSLSPLEAEGPAFLVAPLVAAPKVRSLGLGAALLQRAVAWADPAAVVAVSNPGFYGPLGFRPVRLSSAYAGMGLQMIGDLPQDSPIRATAAFTTL